MATTIPTLSFKPGRLNLSLMANDDVSFLITLGEQETARDPVSPLDITGADVSFRLKDSTGVVVEVPTVITNGPGGEVEVVFTAATTAALMVGQTKSLRLPCEFDVTYASGWRRTYLVGTVSIDPEIPDV